MRLARYTMYTSIFKSLDLPLSGNILGISGLKYFIGSKNYTPTRKIISTDAKITEADYPDVHICNLPYEDNSFDVVIADQVMEHVEGNLFDAMKEVHRVLKPGGIAIITSVFIFRKHWGPKDLWRFSPDGLKYLADDFSEIIESGGWGNRWVHIMMFFWKKLGGLFIPEQKWSLRHWLATHNDPNYPLTTWVVAKK